MRHRLIVHLALVMMVLGAHMSRAFAHPHILATVRLEIVYGERGDLRAVRSLWTYDPFYAAFAKRQIDTNHDGAYSTDELKVFADDQIKALREFDYFTAVTTDAGKVAFEDPTEYGLTLSEGGTLTLAFTRNVTSPTVSGHGLVVEIFDPHFFAYFTLPDDGQAVRLTGAPKGCVVASSGPKPIDLNHTRTISAAFWAALDGATDVGLQFVNRIKVTCP